MKKAVPLACILSIVLLGIGAVAALQTKTAPPPNSDLWQRVDEAVKKGLPKTAVKHLETIIAQAKSRKAYPEAIKAIGKKIALEGSIEGNQPQEKIVRMQAEIAKAPAEMKPVMEAILAEWYWHYFQQNRWRFVNRTQTSEAPGDDFTTWALPRLFAEIDKHFSQALAASDALKRIPIATYDDLLTKGTMPDTLRPTLYDFITHQALQFYMSGEQGLARPEDTFVLEADSPIFSAMPDFLPWQIKTTDDQSATVKAVRLFQQLLRFHQNDADPVARFELDLERLQFGSNAAVGDEKNVRYKAALRRFVAQTNDWEVSSRALHALARVIQQEGDLAEAHRVATQGKSRFPGSPGGKLCSNLIAEIEAKSSSISTERVWNTVPPSIRVHYRNVTRAYFRIIPLDWETRFQTTNRRPEYIQRNERAALLARPPVAQWSVDLPPTTDFKQRTKVVSVEAKLTPGFYVLFSSHTPDFTEQDNVVSYTSFWVSNLALVIREQRGDATVDGFVLDAVSGNPIQDAEVHPWSSAQNRWTQGKPTKTNVDGMFRIKAADRQNLTLFVRHGDQTLAAGNGYYLRMSRRKQAPYSRTVFFTDRSLYRPGQTIQYKGICIRIDQESDNYSVLPNQTVTVVFADRNNKEISRQECRSNDYGSISGHFTAPRDRLMGRMSIYVKGGPDGRTNFNVEEYKRPKFRVTLNAPEKAARLNADVTVKGMATAYTGAAIDAAKVRWRVVRQVRYPIWWYWRCWWMPPQPTPEREIAHGTAVTDVDGSFAVTFSATPDPAVSENDEPTFRYTIHADVTDSAGETRSSDRSIRLGYTALKATLAANDWQTDEKPVEVVIRTTSMDDEGRSAKGNIKVYRLQQPERVARTEWFTRLPVPYRAGNSEPKPDPANPNSWALGELVAETEFATDPSGKDTRRFTLSAGPYRVLLETKDAFGKKVTARLPLRVLSPSANHLTLKVPDLFTAPTWTVEPGDELLALWGSGYDRARAFIEIEHRKRIIQSYWTDPASTQVQIKHRITEAMRGGFTIHVTMVRENRAYLHSQHVDVPWTNKNLSIKWEHFVSKLQPAQKETWTAVITGPDAEKAAAEMVATLYDASLDAYQQHRWQQHFNIFRTDHSNRSSRFQNNLQNLRRLQGQWSRDRQSVRVTFRAFPIDITANLWGYEYFSRRASMSADGLLVPSAAPGMMMEAKSAPEADAGMVLGTRVESVGALALGRGTVAAGEAAAKRVAGAETSPDLSHVSARKNLNETAFFFPHLIADKDGTVRLEFTMPEALTEWKFLGFAHDQKLRAGYLEATAVTAKDLMVQPNPPRFLREGDTLEFTVKVSNQSPTRQTGTVRLTFTDARTDQPVNTDLKLQTTDQPFDIPTKESRTISWRVSVPDDMGFLKYQAVASTGRLSDGEEGYVPVLSRRILVTESLPLPIRGPRTKQFDFTRLLQSGQSDSLEHKTLTVQMVSQPAWYAVMALPYLMEYPHQCNEQVFNRLYANALGQHIVASDPKIRRVFDQWRATPALDSPLEKNADLKAVLLEETPWVRQAMKESEARRNVAVLFDDNRLSQEASRALLQLTETQFPDGAWPWFPGGRPNDYITLYITTGFGRMRHLGVDVDVSLAVKSLNRLDGWIDKRYRDILENGKSDANHLSSQIALYLYGRSFFLKDQAIAAPHQKAVDYFLSQAKKYWLQLACRQSQGHLAIALKRFGDPATARGIMASINERSVHNDELGMFWRDTERSWWWYRAPIETQALMIEAFDEVMNDQEAVEECKVWLLKQKQTQDWKTTKATADAVYALLLRGTNLLASDALVAVSLGGHTIEPENVEAGTGFYEHRFLGPEIKPEFGHITVKKTDAGVSWGSLHWQYLEDMSKVTAYAATPLKLTKTLYVKQATKKGPTLVPVGETLNVGDELVVRIELRVDRDLEYVHMKDQRGSGTEPVNVISRYRYQDGLGYYESTRDTATHFFIDYLPKGVYVFEYSTRVVHRGRYQTGMAQIQCMYAPEFNSHSESFVLEVR